MMEQILKILGTILKPHQILINVPMKEHTSMRVGGTAAILLLPSSIQEIRQITQVLQQAHFPCFVMGNGTNLIFPDAGYPGAIIKLSDNFSNITVEGDRITAQAGASLAAVANAAWKNSLTGLEFASGIPGTTGGAVVMNAGAYDGEMKDVVIQTVSMDESGELVCRKGDEHNFGYRKSCFQKNGAVVLEVTMQLQQGDADQIKEKMQSLNARRREKQPLNMPSAGSIFKRPPGHFAGKLIEEAGLRGFRIGGAQVSEKHCGFIVNTGDATAADIIALIQWVKDKVFQTSGVMLEEEVKILGG